MEKRKTRIATLNSHPIQYYAPMYAHLNRSEDIEITALYCSNLSLRGGNDPGFGRAVKWDIDLLAGYPSVFLGEAANRRVPRGFWSLIVPEVWAEVRSGKYDVLWLHGHAHAANILAFIAAKTRRMPIMMRGDTHLGLKRGLLKRWLRRVAMGLFYGGCDRFLAVGSANRDFYLAMGVPASKIFRVSFAVDNDRFIAAATLNDQERHAWRQRLGVRSDGPIVLFASKLIGRKRPADLIRAAAELRRRGYDFELVIVGTGELEAEMRALTNGLGLQDTVIFAGFFNQSELPGIYAASDIFVLPSENEPWGLVVNEVMCASRPIVTTDEVGCARDLVSQNENGFVYRAGDIGALTEALSTLIERPALRARMGAESLKKISSWSYAQCTEGVQHAIAGLVGA